MSRCKSFGDWLFSRIWLIVLALLILLYLWNR